MTVFENVLVAAQQGAGLRRRASYAAAGEALERAGMAGEANLPAERLGLLQRKRLELARALASRPKLLLLDEVAGGLTDPEVAQLVEIVRGVNAEGIAVIWIEHVVRALVAVVTRLICLAGGKFVGDGDPAEVLAEPGGPRGLPRLRGHRLPQRRHPERGRPMSEPKGRGDAWTEERRRSEEGSSASRAPGGERKTERLLEVRDLTVHHGQLRALDHVSLRVFPGEVYAIIGANGAGKSTLLRTIAGLHQPTEGSIRYDGKDVTRIRPERRATSGIVMVPEGRRLFGSLTVEENLQVGATYARKGPWTIERVYELFSWMKDRRAQRTEQLSGGEQQAVAIGRALVANPRVLLLDELSLGLAPVVVQRIYGMLPQILASGLTVLLVEQDVSQALRVASHLQCLLEGRTTLEGKPSDVTAEQVEAAYFGLRTGGRAAPPRGVWGAGVPPVRRGVWGGSSPPRRHVMVWVNDVIQGILIGGLYALFACGLSLMFGVMKVVNLAHGDLAVIGGYVAVGVITVTHIPVLWSFVIVVPLMAVLGYVLQRTVIQAALDRSILTTLLVTFGLSVVIENALLEFFSANSHSLGVNDAIITSSFSIGSQISIAYLLLLIFVVAVVVLLGLQYFLSRSRYGRMIRAVADDREAAQLSGIDYRHVFGIAAAIAFATVALAGIAYGMYSQFSPTTGTDTILLFAFAAVVIGGLGSLWGTLLGGVVLGVAQAIGAQISGSDEFLAGYIVFLAVLVLRPQGLIATEGAVVTAVAETTARSAEKYRVTRSRRNVAWTGLGALVVVVVLALFPYIVGAGTETILVQAFIILTLASMWNLLAGYAGLVSVGQQAFVGLGAYFVLILNIHNLSMFTALPIAAIGCGVAALPMWWLVSRLRSGYFAIATWVLATTILLIIEKFPSIGGGTGLSLPHTPSLGSAVLEAYTYWIGLAVTVLALLTVYLLLRSRLGLVLTAVRDDEVAARSSGARVGLARMLVFVVAGVGCGAAGALLAVSQLIVQPSAVFSVQFTAEMAFAVIIGGLGTIEGPILGTIVYMILQQTLQSYNAWYLIILGLVAMVSRDLRAARAVGPGRRAPARPAVPGRVLAVGSGQQRPRSRGCGAAARAVEPARQPA